jgi:hypothetical protein
LIVRCRSLAYRRDLRGNLKIFVDTCSAEVGGRQNQFSYQLLPLRNKLVFYE